MQPTVAQGKFGVEAHLRVNGKVGHHHVLGDVTRLASEYLRLAEDWGVSSQMNGLILSGYVKCNMESILCSDTMDWSSDIGRSIAWAILSNGVNI